MAASSTPSTGAQQSACVVCQSTPQDGPGRRDSRCATARFGTTGASFFKKLWEVTDFDDPSTLTVLDFGCGTGLLTEKLRAVCAHVVAVDASSQMVKMLREKIRSREWGNVRGHEAVLAKDPSALADLEGSIDLVVASSVMAFVPEADLGPTMEVIGRLLKPNGVFVHSDWPLSEHNQEKDFMTKEKAMYMYAKGGMSLESDAIVTFTMDESHTPDVFLGVARKA